MINLNIDWGHVECSLKEAVGFAINGCGGGKNVYFQYETCNRECSPSGVFAELQVLSILPTDSAGYTQYQTRCTDITDAAENGEVIPITYGAVDMEVTVDIVARGPAATNGLCNNAWATAIGLLAAVDTEDFRCFLGDALSYQDVDGTPVASPLTTVGMLREQRVSVDLTFLLRYCAEGCPVFSIDTIEAPKCGGQTQVWTHGPEDLLVVTSPVDGQEVSSFVFTGTATPGSQIAIVDKLKVVGEGVADNDGNFSVTAWDGVDLVDAQSKWLDTLPRTFVVYNKWGDCCYTSRCVTVSYNELAP